MDRSTAFNALIKVGDELDAASFSLAMVVEDWNRYFRAALNNPKRPLNRSDIAAAAGRLELTYSLRLFAAFEAILRDYWHKGMRRRTEPAVASLLNSIAARRNIDPQTLLAVHNVRNQRNKMMHRNDGTLSIDFGQSAHTFGKYISWLPDRW